MFWQRRDRCSFAATARALEYDLRILCAKRNPPYELPIGSLIAEELWEKERDKEFKNHKRSWKPEELLNQTLGMDHVNPNMEYSLGCLLTNGCYHHINESRRVAHGSLHDMKEYRRLFAEHRPVIAVFPIIYGHYPEAADRPYLPVSGVGYRGLPTHAVVLVGEYIAEEDNCYKLEPGSYLLYQTSRTKRDDGKERQVVDSLLGDGIGIVHPNLIIEAYHGKLYPPPILATKEEAKVNKGQQLRTYARRKSEFEAKKQVKEMEASTKRSRHQ